MSKRFRRVMAMLVTASALGLSVPVQGVSATTAVSDVPLPGGLNGARTVIGDRAPADRALFLPELIVRFFNTASTTRVADVPELQALVTRLEQCGSSSPSGTTCGPADSLPLPLTADWWTSDVFRGRSTPDTLVRDIVRSHDAALLYWSLLTLDGPTRAWFAQERGLVATATGDRAAVLALAAPGLHVIDGRLSVPGGEPARAAWEALVGAQTSAPTAFVQRLLDADDGWMPFFMASLSHLTPAQLTVVLHLDATDRDLSRDSLRRLHDVFVNAGRGWKLTSRPFSRPPLDPLLLLADLQIDETGHRALIPGGSTFWTAVFEMAASNDLKPPKSVGAATDGPVDVAWLLARVFEAGPTESKLRADQVNFAQRAFGTLAPQDAADVAVTVAALDRYPALIRALERLDIHEPAIYRQAIVRAAALDAIRDATVRTRAIAQFQGALALLLRTVAVGSVASHDASALVTSLIGVPTSDAGRYDGKLTQWIATRLAGTTQDNDAEGALLSALAGPARPVAEVEWEGTRYRIDVSGAEARRIAQTRGETPPPFLASATMLLDLAGRLSQTGSAGSGLLPRATDVLKQIADECGWEGESGGRPAAYQDAVAAARDAVRRTSPATMTTAAQAFGVLADDLTARGVTELAYAIALRTADGGAVTSALLAQRHDFGANRADGARTPVPWRSASQSNGLGGNWNLEGSLLDLDIALAQRSLVRVSWKPLAQPPSITAADRQALSEVPVLMPAVGLTDSSRDIITAALRDGRMVLDRSTDEAGFNRVADAVPLDGIRRALLPWVAANDRERLAFLLTTSELFRLGLGAPGVSTFDSWGASARARLGCLCLRMPPSRQRYMFAWPSEHGHPHECGCRSQSQSDGAVESAAYACRASSRHAASRHIGPGGSRGRPLSRRSAGDERIRPAPLGRRRGAVPRPDDG